MTGNGVVVLELAGARLSLEKLTRSLQEIGLDVVPRPTVSATEALIGLTEHPQRHALLVFTASAEGER